MNNFFTTLKQTGIERYGISISFDGDMVSVSVLPKSSVRYKVLTDMNNRWPKDILNACTNNLRTFPMRY